MAINDVRRRVPGQTVPTAQPNPFQRGQDQGGFQASPGFLAPEAPLNLGRGDFSAQPPPQAVNFGRPQVPFQQPVAFDQDPVGLPRQDPVAPPPLPQQPPQLPSGRPLGAAPSFPPLNQGRATTQTTGQPAGLTQVPNADPVRRKVR